MPRYLTIAETARKLGIGRTHLWTLRKNPHFPKPVVVTDRNRRFVEEEIDEWMLSRPRESLSETNPAAGSVS